MATVFKTPGVYVQEIPKFPPSIAPVETAIPAFIGYTERALRNGESLNLVPTRIESIAEYEELFGGGPAQDVQIFLDNNNSFVQGQANSALYLYDSLRMFYANGGGKCYIVSVGAYPAAGGITAADIEAGLQELEREDEPTIIVLPDAVSIGTGPYSTQQTALAQCNRLMDRVVVCDVVRAADINDFAEEVANFRNGIGINFLKYGIAYGPWLNANLPRQILRRNLLLRRDETNEDIENADIELESLTTDADIIALIGDIRLAEATATNLSDAVEDITGSATGTLDDTLQTALDGYRLTTDASTVDELSIALQQFSNLAFAVLAALQTVNSATYPTDTQFQITETISSYLANPALSTAIHALAAHHNQVGADTSSAMAVIDTTNTDFDSAAQLLAFDNGAALLDADTQPDGPLPDVSAEYADIAADANKARADVARDPAFIAAESAITMFNAIQSATGEFELNLNSTLTVAFRTFKDLAEKAAQALNLLPPSGAIAGVYAAVDRDRGVWKAPANVSLSAVIGPAVKISHEQQAEYNVDVNGGKSINIIRAFTGKGTLVWGARTLAGNDNEWRYVNVRRFFNFVEESVKKATEQFVFEPNDANTWVKIQAMIENFLTTLWRQGALQGIKPEHAFYVAVGLGTTMTPLDILEGRLIVEIGMAAVRPAEFIILRFSHKMAES